jgi:hypothetical protein
MQYKLNYGELFRNSPASEDLFTSDFNIFYILNN